MEQTDILKNDASLMEIENSKADTIEQEFTPEEEKALLKKIDLHLLPTIWIMYLLSYMDRTKYVDAMIFNSVLGPYSY
jgi:hypothetical protein